MQNLSRNPEPQSHDSRSPMLFSTRLRFSRLAALPGAKYFSLLLLLILASLFQKTSGSRTAHTVMKPANTEHKLPKDAMNITMGEPATHTNRATASEEGESIPRNTTVVERPIEKSLWHTLSTLPKGRELVHEVTRIFESRIDFRKLRKGDCITLALDEQVGDKESSEDVMVRAAKLNHWGKDFYAFYFPDENGGSYFDENGKSLKGAFLPSPVSTGRVTSRFSKARLHPVSGKYTPHYGIDYAAPAGTPIASIADGVVQETATHRTMGKFVRIKHSGGYETEYLHMSRYKKGIVPGTNVSQGDVIGYVGTTGTATGPHVELRLKKNGRFIDLSKETFRQASFLPSPLLDCFQDRVELFKESMDSGHDETLSGFMFTCASERESKPL